MRVIRKMRQGDHGYEGEQCDKGDQGNEEDNWNEQLKRKTHVQKFYLKHMEYKPILHFTIYPTLYQYYT